MKEIDESPLPLIQQAWHHRFPGNDYQSGVLYQTSLMSALIHGLYEGNVTYGELHEHGDFGLGTFNGLDGEMVGFDGNFYQVRADGTAILVQPEQKTPFAMVTFFKPDKVIDIPGGKDKEELKKLIEDATEANLFSAIRVDGEFEQVTTRTVQVQSKPYRPLVDSVKEQHQNLFRSVSGTLAGFRSPPYAQGIGVSGLHLHFLREDKKAGGHALDYRIRKAKLQFSTLHDFHLELPASASFLKTELADDSLDEQIKATEG